MTFSQYARSKRVEAKLSQQFVADTLDLSHRSDVYRKETGKIRWHFEEVEKLAYLLGMTTSEFIAGYETLA